MVFPNEEKHEKVGDRWNSWSDEIETVYKAEEWHRI